LLALATPIAAQEDSTLVVAVRLATEGQADSARSLVRTRLAGTSPADSLYPKMLYSAGIVALDLDSAMLYFRRVSIEYARSAWADRAHLRLAQLAFAAGDYQAALRSSERVLTDYPFSEVAAEASFWAGRAQLELGDAADGCRSLNDAAFNAGDNVELANRARYHLQRCGGILQAGDTLSDSVEAQPVPAGTNPVYTVQVAAVQSATAADELMRQLHAAGYEPHVVRDGALFKVRVGRYPERNQAQRQVRPLQQRFGGNPFVVEEQ
jgi:tetratricopeptide (TPR) repeat protein